LLAEAIARELPEISHLVWHGKTIDFAHLDKTYKP
jgi:hypothetical protein